MGDVIGPVILGIIISILGISNMKGNISSLHWYHRQRVSPDDVMPFGKRVGLGTLIIGNYRFWTVLTDYLPNGN